MSTYIDWEKTIKENKDAILIFSHLFLYKHSVIIITNLDKNSIIKLYQEIYNLNEYKSLDTYNKQQLATFYKDFTYKKEYDFKSLFFDKKDILDDLLKYENKQIINYKWSDPMDYFCREKRFEIKNEIILSHLLAPRYYQNKNKQNIYESYFQKNKIETNKNEELEKKYKKLKQALPKGDEYKKLSNTISAYNDLRNIVKNQFIDKEMLKLASINTEYGIIASINRQYSGIDDKNLNFVSLEDGPGSWVEYIQYLLPNATAVGITKKNILFDYKIPSKINTKQFYPYYGDDGTGSLITNWKSMINYSKKTLTEIHLVVSNGKKIHSDDKETEKNTFKLSLTKCLVGISLLTKQYIKKEIELIQVPEDSENQSIKDGYMFGDGCFYKNIETKILGGNMIIKFYKTLEEESCHLLYLISCCFEWITFYKPVTSRDNNNEKYLICFNHIGNDSVIDILSQAMKKDLINTLINPEQIPDDFREWLRTGNDIYLQKRIDYMEGLYEKYKSKNDKKNIVNLNLCQLRLGLKETIY